MRKFLRGIGNAFLTIVVLILIVYGWMFIEVKLRLKSYPELFGYVFFLQEEADMSPQFEVQDVIMVKKDEEYKVGDIIMYFDGKDSKYKVHNVVALDRNTTVTRCASCEKSNEPISNDAVVGKAVGKVMFMGAIVGFFSQKIVLVIFALVGVTFLVVSQYHELKPKKEVDKKEKDTTSETDDINQEK